MHGRMRPQESESATESLDYAPSSRQVPDLYQGQGCPGFEIGGLLLPKANYRRGAARVYASLGDV
jgi:hypothetical protein